MALDRKRGFTQFSNVNEAAEANKTAAEEALSALVFDETVRRALRKTPQERFDSLRAALRHAEKRGLIPKRDRAAHEKRLLWLIQGQSSSN